MPILLNIVININLKSCIFIRFIRHKVELREAAHRDESEVIMFSTYPVGNIIHVSKRTFNQET